jgi:O-antigen ligase
MSFTDLIKKDKAYLAQGLGLFVFAATLPFSVTFIQIGILLFIAASLWRRYSAGTIAAVPAEMKAIPLFIPWLIYLAAGALASAFGISPLHSFAALNSDLLTATAFLGLCLFLEPEQREPALKIYLLAVTVAAIYGLAQALGGLAHGQDVRAHAVTHPVRFGEILVIGLALAVSLVSSPEGLSPRLKKAAYASVLLIIAAIVLSQTRGAYIGMALVLASMLAIKRPTKRILLPIIAAAAALILFLSMLSPVVRYKIGYLFRGATSTGSFAIDAANQSINTRMVLWKTGLKMIKDRPVFGSGPANTKELFPLYCPKPYPENTVWGSLHNLYIHQAAERGLVGLSALLLLFASMFMAALRALRAAPSALTIWPMALIFSWFLMNVTEISFQHVHTSYAVLLALAAAITSAKAK